MTERDWHDFKAWGRVYLAWFAAPVALLIATLAIADRVITEWRWLLDR